MAAVAAMAIASFLIVITRAPVRVAPARAGVIEHDRASFAEFPAVRVEAVPHLTEGVLNLRAELADLVHAKR